MQYPTGMIPRNPPPAPHLHASNLPHAQHPVRHNNSQGDTEVSYTVYSPSPSSLSAHRFKWSRIRDWRTHNPAPPVRHLNSIASHRPSVGVGSATWSDSGTGLDEGQTDIGTIPTTVRVDRELRESTIVSSKRDRVDPIRAMGSHHSRRIAKEDDGEPSELPYRQDSQRRDGRPADDSVKHHARPINPSQRYDPSRVRTAQNGQHQHKDSQPARPPLVHSSSRSKPTPQLARPPVTQPTPPVIQILPAGSPVVTSPESDKRNAAAKNSPFAIREAYLNSALTLPLDMLAQTEKPNLAPPATELRPAKSQSSISSGLTTGRLGSLLGNSRGPSPNGGMKRVVSDSQAIRQTRADSKIKPAGGDVKMPPVGRGEAIENLIEPKAEVRQAHSNSSSQTVRPTSRTNDPPPRSLGSAGQLARSATVPNNVKLPSAPPQPQINPTKDKSSATDINTVKPTSTRPQQSSPRPKELSALGLELGTPAPSSQLQPVATIPLQPAPHRQVTALRRPALTPRNSTDNLAATLGIGRKLRDPSMTDLRTRFEPASYPLPDSKSSASGTKSQTSTSGVAQDQKKVPTMTSIKAKDKVKDIDPARANGSRTSTKKANSRTAEAGVASVPMLNVSPEPNVLNGSAAPPPAPPMRDLPPVTSPVPPIVHPMAPPVEALPVRGTTLPPLERLHSTQASALETTSHNRPDQVYPNNDQSFTSQTRESSSLLSPRPHAARHASKEHRVDRIREDDDRVSFEVPNGARGRLRVSLAWFRDRGRHSDRTQTPSDAPPPLPPKPRRMSALRRPPIMPEPISSTDTPDQISPIQRRPSPRPTYQEQRPSPIRSPIHLDPPPTTQRVYPNFDPYRPHATVPVYRPAPAAPHIPAFQMTHPLAYPQPHPWASHPQLVPPHVQIQPPQAQGSRRPPSMESIDPPSGGGSPPGRPAGLPGMLGPMAMQSNMLHPFSTQSLHPNGMPQSPSRVGFGDQNELYGRPQQPIWKRMFNGNGMGYGMNDDHHDENDWPPLRGGNDKIGKWMRGVTPGRAPPPRSQAPGTVAGGGMFGSRGLGGGREYTLTQPFFRRSNRDQYNTNGNANPYAQAQSGSPNMYANHLDMLDSQPRRRSAFLPRQGGMLDRMFTPATRRQNPGGVWSTNQPRRTTAWDARARYKEARRREKIDRRNARAQGQAQGRFLQTQTQRQRGGRSQTMVRDWVGRFGNGNRVTNGYGPQAQGMGRKVSRGEREGGRWKDRLPRTGTGGGQRGRGFGDQGGGGGGGNGLGLTGIGRAFRR